MISGEARVGLGLGSACWERGRVVIQEVRGLMIPIGMQQEMCCGCKFWVRVL